MTLEQVVMYLWSDMQLSGWVAIINCALLIVGIKVVLNGRVAVRSTSSHSTMIAETDNGQKIESQSHAFGLGYEEARRTVRLGYVVVLFAVIGLAAALMGI